MDAAELAVALRVMYESAKRNEAACQVHLFGIRYAKELQASSETVKDIVKRSGINMGYVSEVSKGIKLAQYVDLKREYMEQLDATLEKVEGKKSI